MNMERQVLADAAVGVGIATVPEALDVLHQPGCAAAIWRRQLPKDVTAWLDGLAPERLPVGRVVLRPNAVTKTVEHLCEMAGTPAGAERDWFIADVADLAERFAGLMEADYVRLRLDAIETNACRKFHIDAVTARLVCTYRGPGTQYGISPDGEEPARIFETGPGAPMVLRGTRWPEYPKSGLLHRSPPIEGTGTTRLVLVFDPISEAALAE